MEVILMVGIPGSGKTTLARVAFPSHVRISLDDIRKLSGSEKSRVLAQCHRDTPRYTNLGKDRRIECVQIYDALQRGDNIVIDDTNVTRRVRERHVMLAKAHGAVVNAVYFSNTERAFRQNEGRKARIDDGGLYASLARMEPPEYDEGFTFIQIMS